MHPLFTPLTSSIAHDNPLTFIFRGSEFLLGEIDGQLPDRKVCEPLAIDEALLQPLGFFADSYCCTVAVPEETAAPAGFEFVKLRAVVMTAPEGVLSLASRACQIAEWARTHQFCGACASRMLIVTGERCFKCPSCGLSNYPRISPAMMVLITRGDEALLARHAASTANMFSALAGFVEAGESIEETVHREVFEEVGLQVHNLHYFGSQPWPFPNSLMIAFKAEYLDGEIRLQEKEIAEARWFSRGALPLVPGTHSIAGNLLRSHFGDID